MLPVMHEQQEFLVLSVKAKLVNENADHKQQYLNLLKNINIDRR